MHLIGLAVVGFLCLRLSRSAASGFVEPDVAAGLSCSVGNSYIAAQVQLDVSTAKSLLTLKQVVEEQLGRLKVQARLPSRGFVHSVEALLVLRNMSQSCEQVSCCCCFSIAWAL